MAYYQEGVALYSPQLWDKEKWKIEDIIKERLTPQGKEYKVV